LARRRHGLEDEEGGEEDASRPIGALRPRASATMAEGSGRGVRAGASQPDGGSRLAQSIAWYLAVSAIVFTLGAIGVITRRNPLVVLLCLELNAQRGKPRP